jgi:hypothetical protein
MKKAFIGLISLMLLGFIAWALFKQPKATHYPHASVAGSVRATSLASGSKIMEQLTASEAVRASLHPTINGLYKQISGKPLYNDIDEYLCQLGTDSIRVRIYHSLGNVVSVEIRPSATPSKLAQAFRAALTTSYPDLDCHVVSP